AASMPPSGISRANGPACRSTNCSAANAGPVCRSNPNEWLDLVSGRLIDFIRCHLSQVGGISAGRKIAAFCDFFRVRTAWHGPGDTSPVGHAAHVHLDLATWNFGIQEYPVFSEALREVFPGTPELRDGMMM